MAGYGVGGAAASGLQAGFDMGLRADDAAERRRIATVAENRQAMLDTERQAQTARHNERQDKADAWAEEDRALEALNKEREDLALEGAGLSAQYGGPDKIPGDVGSDYARRAGEIGTRRAALLAKRYAPVVEKEQQWARDTASRIQAGQQSLEDLTPTETVRMLQALTRRPVGDFLAGGGGKSRVRQGIDDTTAGIQTQNQGLLLQGAGTLLDPDLQEGVGHTAADGSEIVRKELYGLVPAMPGPGGLRAPGAAPQSLAATLNAVLNPNPNPTPQGQAQEPPPKLMPVLRVTARHPDGTEVSYHAPVTKGRGTGASDEVHPGFDLSAAMDRLGQLGALEAWANTPAARAKIEAGLKELGAESNSFLGAYYAMKGNPNSLLPPGETDPVAKKIAAVTKLAKEQFGGDFRKAMLAYEGRTELGPLAKKLADIEASGLSPEDKAAATRIAAMGVKGAGVGGGGGSGGGIGLIHRVGKLTPEQNDALFGPQGAVTEGRLDPNRINSRTASIFADAELTSPGTDFAKMSGDIALGRNPTFRTRAIIAETLPAVMKNMTEAGKKLEFSDVRARGKMQAWVKGQLNDPQWVYYMVHRNDALMTIANVMRGVGMSDQAHRAEMEVTDPAMSPAALDAWFASQMAALKPRLELNRAITEGGSAAKPRSGGAAPAAAAKPAVQTATNPKTGEKLMLQNGQWVPFK